MGETLDTKLVFNKVNNGRQMGLNYDGLVYEYHHPSVYYLIGESK